MRQAVWDSDKVCVSGETPRAREVNDMRKAIARIVNYVLLADPIWYIVAVILFVVITAALIIQP
jgi:hypothetical protein